MFNLDYSILNSKYNFYKKFTIETHAVHDSHVFSTTFGTSVPETVTVASQ
jgi:hypothetical protein